jgi:TolB-like protein
MRMVGPHGEDALPHPRKTRAMLAYLCLEHPKRVSRSRLTALLWDKPDHRARRNLRDALYHFELANGAKTAGLIKLDNEYVALNADICWIDVIAAPANYLEPLLEDLDGISEAFDEWLTLERRRFQGHVRDVLQAEVTALGEANAPADRQISAARKLINFDNTHEPGVHALMKLLADSGRHAEALREYERFSSELQKELKISPSREIEALSEAIRIVSRRNSVSVRTPRAGDLVALNANSAAPPGAREPSIAVLPFQNLSGHRKHDFTTDGLAENLIAVLSRVPGFFVISRLSTLTFKNKARRPQEIADLLGVRYILSGSMRFFGSRLSLTAELTGAERGVVLHSWTIEERLSDLIDVQMRLAEAVVQEIAPHLRAAELKRVHAKRPEQLDAYDFFLRAQEDMHNSSYVVFSRAEHLFDEALKRDANYAAALAWRAYWHVLRVGQGWSPDPARDARLGAEFARRAADCDPFEPMALAVQGHIATYVHKDFDLGFQQFETARRVNPNAAPAWLWSAAASAWVGEGARAVDEVTKATALSPYDPLMYAHSSIASVAHLAAGQYELAVERALRSIQENPNFTATYKLLIIALVLAGREEEAKAPVHRLLRLESGFTVEKYRRRNPHISRHAELYYDALELAGVPLHG